MIVSDHCLSRKIMRRRELACRPAHMCHECEDAVRAAASRNSDAISRQGEQHDASSPSGKSDGVEASDPTLQLGNIVVELDDGCVERIRMNDTESAEEVATKVCRRNDLPDKFIALLAEHIIDRYPTRRVDQKKEQLTETNTETRESTPAKNQTESKTMKNKSTENSVRSDSKEKL